MDSGAALSGLAGPKHPLDNQLWEDSRYMFYPLAISVLGAIFGLLCAHYVGMWTGNGAAWLSSPPGTGVRRAALLLHGMVILRDIWCGYTKPGTFRRYCREAWEWLLGRWRGVPCKQACRGLGAVAESPGKKGSDCWYVNKEDLQFFKSQVEGDLKAGSWKSVCQKELNGELTYSAWCRVLPDRNTQYKTITVIRDISAEEMMDFYLDDPYRTKWDGLLSHHEILEQASFSDRHQVVRWKRSFPFNFITDREYVIGRRVFREGDKLYAVTKSIEHPLAPLSNDIVRMDMYYSMWCTQTIPCPWGTNRKACEVVLLHLEQFKIPERLARFAACKGMWGFVKKMAPSVREFTAERRQRCGQDERDVLAYGAGITTGAESKDAVESDSGRKQRFRPFRIVRRVVVAGFVATVVIILKHKA